MAQEQASPSKNNKINLNITTPRGLKFALQADMIIMRCIDGDLGVLYGHEPVSAVLGDGILRIFQDGNEKKLALFGGIAEIDQEEVNIFTTIAQHPEEIDLERARTDREEAEAAMNEESEELQLQNSQLLLRRSLVRIEVSLHIEEAAEYYEENEEES
ncbi:ATP synthase F1 subunit epsilon [Blautia liquoris]|uniref:ATP synthase epsilon chain n=1 Tax=Blautia liquoris TaxID=2779518 RepID=A0A7M2RL21_9FIRM|nr:ATP synthase F1 subunit epsilon [Blautia liquoris]QOV20761.1 ATP synthase F1 subunit epsilon [Blautia liquoris]